MQPVVKIKALLEVAVGSLHNFITSMFYIVNRILVVGLWHLRGRETSEHENDILLHCKDFPEVNIWARGIHVSIALGGVCFTTARLGQYSNSI